MATHEELGLRKSAYELLELIDQLGAYAYCVGWLVPRLEETEIEQLRTEMLGLFRTYRAAEEHLRSSDVAAEGSDPTP